MVLDTKRIIVRNSFYTVLNDIINIPLKLILISYMIRQLGLAEYGIWSLLGVLGGQIAQMSLSVPQGIIKYVPEYYAKKQYARINQLLSSAVILYFLLGLIVFGIAIIAQTWIYTDLFHISSTQYGYYTFVFWGAVLVFIGNQIFGIFPSLLNGLQRMDIVSKISMVSNIAEVILSLIVLYLGWGLFGLVGLMVVVDSLTILIYIIFAKYLFKPLQIRLSLFDLVELKKILKYSLQLQVSGIASQVVVDLPKVFISYYLGTAATGIYDVALKVVAILRKLLMRLISPIMPTASELFALQENTMIRRLFQQSLRYLYLVGFPLFAFIFAFARELVHFWLGAGVDITIAASTMRWLAVCFWLNLTVIPAAYLLNGIGKPKYGMYSAVLTLILMVFLTPYAIYFLKYTGAVIAVFLSWGLSAIVLHYNFFQTMKFSLRAIPIKPTVYYPLQIIIVTGICYFINRLLPMQLSFFIPIIFVTFIGYSFLLFWCKYIELYDVELIQPYIPNRLFLILRRMVT
ncbi:MAG: oligosaccharide flippase family protein [bacterium]|nr:oligosaccharide flippase family protein [bacterium]